ncbi:MAG: hypothetical protein PHN42_01625 [Bacilli bacterium]|nr:hypothetical protein [Bacilli bacterium]
MKTKIKLGILLIVFLLSSYLIYTFVGDESLKPTGNKIVIEKNTDDEIKFKKEYESLNNKNSEKGYQYLNLNIIEDNNIEYIDQYEVIDILKNKTGIIYFGFPECPWCRNMISTLINTSYEFGVDKIYYYNAYDIRDIKHLDEQGNIITDKEGTDEYYQIVDLLKDYLGIYEGLNNESIKRLYFPTVVFVKNGEIKKVHIGTVSDQEDPTIELTEEQKNNLIEIYTDGIAGVYDILCDEDC